jgi:hypothetical protein
VAEIFNAMLMHLTMCIHFKDSIPNPDRSTLVAPTIKFGSFVPPPSAARPMQMLLLSHIITRLSDNSTDLEAQIRELISERKAGEGPPSPDDDAMALSQALANKVKESAGNIVEQFKEIRNQMLKVGFLA